MLKCLKALYDEVFYDRIYEVYCSTICLLSRIDRSDSGDGIFSIIFNFETSNFSKLIIFKISLSKFYNLEKQIRDDGLD